MLDWGWTGLQCIDTLTDLVLSRNPPKLMLAASLGQSLAYDDPVVLHEGTVVQQDSYQMSLLRRGPGWGRGGALTL